MPFFGDLKTRHCCNQGGRLALHVLALACAWILHSLHLHRLVRRTCFHEGPPTIQHQATYDCLQPLPNSAQPVAFPKGKLLLADWSLQLALSISGLFKFWRGHVGSRYDLVVLLFKAGWHHRLLFLCAAKEMEAPLYSPCFPSWYHALHFLVRYQVSDISNRMDVSATEKASSINFMSHQISGWRSHYFLRVPEHGGTCGNVLLLSSHADGTLNPKVSLVEEVFKEMHILDILFRRC